MGELHRCAMTISSRMVATGSVEAATLRNADTLRSWLVAEVALAATSRRSRSRGSGRQVYAGIDPLTRKAAGI
jgi:hypothetical protein